MDEKSLGSIRDEELADVSGGAEGRSVGADFDTVPVSELYKAPLCTITPVSAKSGAEIALEAVRASVKVGHSLEVPSPQDQRTTITGYSQAGADNMFAVSKFIGED